ncbi:hypothetical protein L218DRAFT_944677 [Marasmius fiardii PR-910]|nr:hypothetical protein L218DRAFT_944677 [Marasmius fiardii PR-910]
MGKDLFETFKERYSHQTSADALFFNGGGHKGLRVEVSNLGIEFIDGAYIGTGPSGLFYYNYRGHFDAGDQVNYKITREINPSDSKVLAHVKFFSNVETQCYAELLAYDPQETINAASMNGYQHGGKWQDLTLGSAPATVKKFADQRTLSLTVAQLGKKAQWPDKNKVTGREALHGKAVNVNGMLHFKNSNTVANVKFANYNNDRIVFYENDHTSAEFVAFRHALSLSRSSFVAFESWPSTLGVIPNATAIYENINWSNA